MNLPQLDQDEQNIKKRVMNLCVALKITDDKQKLALPLNCIEKEAYDIYDNLLNPGTEETFESALQLLDDHFNPCKNLEYETFQFCQITQRQDETIHQFYIPVKDLKTN